MDSIVLYHGSRGGIKGDIRPESRSRCDFGKGFYMGDNMLQAKTLVAHDTDPVLYKLQFDIGKIDRDKVLRLNGMDWAFFVLFNRDKLESIKNTELYRKMSDLEKSHDLIIGPIADDSLNESMKKFTSNLITDVTFLNSVSALNYGIQYVAKTEESCKQISVLEEKELYGQELTEAIVIADENRKRGAELAARFHKSLRREGLYFDEIMENQLKKERGDKTHNG